MSENIKIEQYQISGDKQLLQLERIHALLKQTYWASKRDIGTIKKSLEHSICYGVYLNGLQIGFARVITDFATAYYLCDVIIDKAHRGIGLGKKLIDTVIHDEQLAGLSGMLITTNAHGLYEKFGFVKDAEKFMARKKKI